MDAAGTLKRTLVLLLVQFEQLLHSPLIQLDQLVVELGSRVAPVTNDVLLVKWREINETRNSATLYPGFPFFLSSENNLSVEHSVKTSASYFPS